MSTVSVPKAVRPRPARPVTLPLAPPKRRSGWGRRIGWIAGVALLGASLLGARHVLQVGVPAAAQPVAPPPSPSAANRIVCHGHFDVDPPAAALGPTVPGRVKEVFVKDFDVVKKGQRLLTLDDQAVADKIALATVAVSIAEAQLREAEQGLAQHAKGMEEQTAAIQAAMSKAAAAKAEAQVVYKQINTITTQDQYNAKQEVVAAAEAAVAAERAKLETLRAARPTNKVDQAAGNVELARTRLAEAERARRDFIVDAPEDGVVLRVGLAAGSVIGLQSRDVPVLFVPASARRVVRVELDQEVAYKVKVGHAAEVSDKYDRGTHWTGKVVAIAGAYLPRRGSAGAIVAGPDVKVLECLIELDATETPPRLNQPMTVAIQPPPK